MTYAGFLQSFSPFKLAPFFTIVRRNLLISLGIHVIWNLRDKIFSHRFCIFSTKKKIWFCKFTMFLLDLESLFCVCVSCASYITTLLAICFLSTKLCRNIPINYRTFTIILNLTFRSIQSTTMYRTKSPSYILFFYDNTFHFRSMSQYRRKDLSLLLFHQNPKSFMPNMRENLWVCANKIIFFATWLRKALNIAPVIWTTFIVLF